MYDAWICMFSGGFCIQLCFSSGNGIENSVLDFARHYQLETLRVYYYSAVNYRYVALVLCSG